MKVCIHFGFSFEPHHFSLSSVQKRLMVSLKGNWSVQCITAKQKGIISALTKFKLLGSKELSINILKYLLEYGTRHLERISGGQQCFQTKGKLSSNNISWRANSEKGSRIYSLETLMWIQNISWEKFFEKVGERRIIQRGKYLMIYGDTQACPRGREW